jgi:uncharacterized protein
VRGSDDKRKGESLMPITPTYPGVYIEEIPSGVRTITGVATSITAFIGRARRGATNNPVVINSFGDFERTFGGLQEGYLMSYAVRDFYLNGGSQALIVRLVNPNTDSERDEAIKPFDAAKAVADAATGAADVSAAKTAAGAANDTIQNDTGKSQAEKAAAKKVFDAVSAATTLDAVKKAVEDNLPKKGIPGKAVLRLPTATAGQDLVLEASNEGEWGNGLRARVDYEGLDTVGNRYEPLTKDDLFNLTIRDMDGGAIERFLNLTLQDSPRRVNRVLENGSNLLRVHGSLPTTLPNLPKETDAVMDEAIDQRIDGDSSIPAAEKSAEKEKAKKEARKVEPFSRGDMSRPAGERRSVGVAKADHAEDGGKLSRDDVTAGDGLQDNKKGLYALDKADLFNLLCIPPEERGESTANEVYQDALAYCQRRRAMLIVDSPAEWSANKETAAATAKEKLPDLNMTGENARNAALFFPRVIQSDPEREGQTETFVPCGIVAGVMARTDTTRGVWKAPAGLDAALNGIQGLEVDLNDTENGLLNPLGINCLRYFPVAGRVVWGARTLRGADQLADEWKYIPVRRLALYIEESLYRGTQWVVFEPNDEPLWAQIRLNVGAFMRNLFRQGAFQGKTPQEAYFVKCDKETTTQNDINLGIVNVVVGFAPLKPAEFLIIKIQQMAGEIET